VKTDKSHKLVVRRPGLVPYQTAWDSMRRFNDARSADTADEVWLLQHPPVYTLGLNNKSAPPLQTDIPIVQTDRGGQITYHGPGQLIVYTLFDLERLRIGIKQLVSLLEQSVIELMQQHGIPAQRLAGAPGVYVAQQKLAALGLRVRRHSSYHGLSVNVDMDLSPFSQIDPCGYADMEVTDMKTLGLNLSPEEVSQFLLGYLTGELGYTGADDTALTELP